MVSRRLHLLLLVFGVCAAVVLYDRQTHASAPSVSLAVARPARTAAPGARLPARTEGGVPPQSQTVATLLPRDDYGGDSADAFAPLTPPPPAPTIPVAEPVPPPPTAPALPFTVIGKKQEGDAWEVYLSRGGNTYVVRVGDTLDEVYSVVAIEPPLMRLAYLPLNEQQTLNIGAPLHD